VTIEELMDSRPGESADAGIGSKIDKAKRFMARNCYKKVSLEDAASSVALSPKYFSRVFKDIAGIGFNEYRSEIRVREARSLLKNSGLNIYQISHKIGYENTESFTRLFKSSTGLTPSGYRKRYSKNNKAKTLKRGRRS
jgi:two-component system response regulator YesN